MSLLPSQSRKRAEALFLEAARNRQGALVELASLYRDALKVLAQREIDKVQVYQTDQSSVVQESMIRISRHEGYLEYRGLSEFEGWLVTVLRNVVRDKKRFFTAEKRNADREQPLDELDSQAFWQHARAPRVPQPDSELVRQDERGQRWQAVRRALSLLPEHYQAVIRARYEEKKSPAEIAKELNTAGNGQKKVTSDAVRMLLRRALKKLTQILAEDADSS